jgi:hypothetical protein
MSRIKVTFTHGGSAGPLKASQIFEILRQPWCAMWTSSSTATQLGPGTTLQHDGQPRTALCTVVRGARAEDKGAQSYYTLRMRR